MQSIDDKLTINDHISKLCKKASQNLHALGWASKLYECNTTRINMNSFFTSQFKSYSLAWIFHS